MEKLDLYKRLIIGLTILNMMTLGFIIFTTFSRPIDPPKGNRMLDDFFNRELKLDANQQKSFEMQKRNHRAAVDSLNAEMSQVRSTFYALNSFPDSVHLAEIAGIQSKIELVTFNHFKEVRAGLKAEQQIKFDAIIQKAVNKMGMTPHFGKPK